MMMGLAALVKVLSQDEMGMVHEKALELLKKRGIVFESDDTIETFVNTFARVENHTVF